MKNFIRTMLEEKGILENQFQVQVDGMIHFMSVNNIVDLIEQAPKHEQKKIIQTFSKIDFMNGDLMHYIKFLAEAYIRTNYSYQY